MSAGNAPVQQRRALSLQRVAPALVLVVLALVPLQAGRYFLLTVTAALALGLFALSYDLVLGVTGLISVSHATLFGVGAYGMAIGLSKLGLGFWPAVAFGIGVTALVAWLIGFFSVRTAGAGFIIMTVIFAHASEVVVNVWTSVTGGENGIILTLGRLALLPGVTIQATPGSRSFYYVVLVFLITALWLCRRLVRSPFGLVLRGIKGNEVRTAALGYRVSRYKIVVNIVAGALAALAGILYAISQGFVSVDLVRVLLSVEVIVWTILGGPGTLLGPVLAAVLMTLLVEYLRGLTRNYLIVVGLATLAVVVFIPNGLGGMLERLRARTGEAGGD
ncbi:MAG: branched-chain amino acid ABC transporter permease [Armatimonadota bacterium]